MVLRSLRNALAIFFSPVLFLSFCGVKSPGRPRRAIRTQLAVITTSGGQKRKKGGETTRRQPVGAGRNRETIDNGGSPRGMRTRKGDASLRKLRSALFPPRDSPRRADRPATGSGKGGNVRSGTLRHATSYGYGYLHTQASRASRAAKRRILLDCREQPCTISISRAREREKKKKHPVAAWRNSRRDHLHA